MKKMILYAILCVLPLVAIAQDDVQDENNSSSTNFNEIKLNALYLVGGAFDLSYERTLNEESGLGLNVFIPFDDDIKEDVNFYLSPYYRFYFGKKYAAGFFIEGFALLGSYNYFTLEQGLSSFDPLIFDVVEETVIDLGVGIGFGGKWVTNSGFIGELNLGFARNFFNTEDTDFEIIAKAGITIGYRF